MKSSLMIGDVEYVHVGDCAGSLCTYCGCCMHTETTDGDCKVWNAPVGMRCPDRNCGCEGAS